MEYRMTFMELLVLLLCAVVFGIMTTMRDE